MDSVEFPINLYCKTAPKKVETLDLCRGEDDFRKVYIVDTDDGKVVIKNTSNTFSDRQRIEGWHKLMAAYRDLGIYCPSVLPNLNGEIIHHHVENGRDYYIFAEEFAKYETADKKDKENPAGYEKNAWQPAALRALGRVANARLEIMEHPSAYCLLKPFCPPDTVDEATECSVRFTERVKKDFPEYAERADKLLALFEKNKLELEKVYSLLPTSCFQSDLNSTNILVDDKGAFVGLIDFNLCGKEPVLNYAVRASLWLIEDPALFGENDSRLYLYDSNLDRLRDELFIKNIGYIQEEYAFSETERAVFPALFRYMNTYWWYHIDELEHLDGNAEKVGKILDWLQYQMTRDDIRLP